MIADRQKTTDEVKQINSKWTSQSDTADIHAGLAKANAGKVERSAGNDFNEQYHSDQVSAHKDAVDLFKRYGDSGENAELKAWAAKTRPALEHHMQMAEGLDK